MDFRYSFTPSYASLPGSVTRRCTVRGWIDPFSLWVSSYLFLFHFNSLNTSCYCYSFVCKWRTFRKVEVFSCVVKGDSHYFFPEISVSLLLNIRIKYQTISSILRFHYACGGSTTDKIGPYFQGRGNKSFPHQLWQLLGHNIIEAMDKLEHLCGRSATGADPRPM